MVCRLFEMLQNLHLAPGITERPECSKYIRIDVLYRADIETVKFHLPEQGRQGVGRRLNIYHALGAAAQALQAESASVGETIEHICAL